MPLNKETNQHTKIGSLYILCILKNKKIKNTIKKYFNINIYLSILHKDIAAQLKFCY